MVRDKSRSGFTLVELMVAATIFTIMMSALFSSFVGGIRLLKATFATSEMSLRARDLRERLLFHAAPTHHDTIWAGLLSGTNGTDVLTANATKILMYCQAMKSSTGTRVDQTIQVKFKNYGSSTCSFYSEDLYDRTWPQRWLNPGGLNLLADSGATTPLVWARKSDNTEDRTRFYIHLTGRMDVAGIPIEHGERIVVPIFGSLQETRMDGKGGLDK